MCLHLCAGLCPYFLAHLPIKASVVNASICSPKLRLQARQGSPILNWNCSLPLVMSHKRTVCMCARIGMGSLLQAPLFHLHHRDTTPQLSLAAPLRGATVSIPLANIKLAHAEGSLSAEGVVLQRGCYSIQGSFQDGSPMHPAQEHSFKALEADLHGVPIDANSGRRQNLVLRFATPTTRKPRSPGRRRR